MTPGRDRPVAVVTGASRGLGAVLGKYLASAGYDLIVGARGRAELAAAVEPWRKLGSDVVEVPGDVADPATRAAFRAAAERAGRADVLVNNASELGPGGRPSLLKVPPADLARTYEVNVIAPLELVAELLSALRRSPAPLIVNISSDAATGGYPGWGPYGATKAALDLVSKTLAEELAADGVSVVAVDPGDLRTTLHQAAFAGEDISDRPLPDVTVPFWAWLFGQSPNSVTGRRFRAQAERWGEPA